MIPRVPLESTEMFLLRANTESAGLESTLWRQINKVKWNMINIIESPFVSPLKMIQTDLLPGLGFNGAEAHYVLCYLGRANVIGILKGFFFKKIRSLPNLNKQNMSFVGGYKIIEISLKKKKKNASSSTCFTFPVMTKQRVWMSRGS